MKINIIIAMATISLFSSTIEGNGNNIFKEVIVTLNTRSGITQKFLMIVPKNPTSVVVLFPGGKGNLNLNDTPDSPLISWGRNNFLVRSRSNFAKNGFIVAVVDSPSDCKGKKGMYGVFRASMNHVKDIDCIMDYCHSKFSLPVWLVGISRGTESVANIAINSKKDLAGLVLASSLSVINKKGISVPEMNLSRITIPTLIVSNKNDRCPKSPPQGMKEIAGRLINSKKVTTKSFTSDNKPGINPCKGRSAHGFYGIENKVVDYISDFIKQN